MATVQKIISLGSFEEEFTLIALHSPLEDFALTYAINRHLRARFKRFATDLELAKGGHFPVYEWKDDINERNWLLMSNHCSGEPAPSFATDLFGELPSTIVYTLVPEHREVDYLLKLESENLWETPDIVRQLTSIPRVLMAYEVDTERLKSKNNLIF